MTNSAKSLRVTDSSCTAEYPQREHTIKHGGELITVVFKYGEDKILPYEQALKFNVDGFKLHELDGGPLVMPAVAKDNVKASLGAGEAVANLEELTLSSLKLRAAQKAGGEIYLNAEEDDRADLIAFIKGEAPKAGADETAPVVVGDAEEDLVDDGADGEELAALMAGKGHVAPPQPVTDADVAGLNAAKEGQDAFHAETVVVQNISMTASDHFVKEPVVIAAADVGTIDFNDLGPDAVVVGNLAEISTVAGDKPADLKEVTVPVNPQDAADLAAVYGLSLEGVSGSGANGEVLKSDVEAIVQQNQLKPVKAE